MSGERAAVGVVIEQNGAELDEVEQLGLFAPAATELGEEMARIKRGAGRPPGARNQRTERMVAFLLARHRDPREVLLEIAEANVNDLAALLGCTLHEALQEKRLAAIGVLPYVAQRMPLAVDVTDRKIVHLTIVDGLVDSGEPGADSVAVRVLQNVEYQQVGDDAAAPVGQSEVGQEGQPLDDAQQ